jgi:hypothetical protein
MCANAQHLDNCQFFVFEGGLMEFVNWDVDKFAHSTITMHAKHLQVSTAIVEASKAWATLPAVQIGTHATSITNLQVVRAICGTDCDDLNGKFMP